MIRSWTPGLDQSSAYPLPAGWVDHHDHHDNNADDEMMVTMTKMMVEMMMSMMMMMMIKRISEKKRTGDLEIQYLLSGPSLESPLDM